MFLRIFAGDSELGVIQFEILISGFGRFFQSLRDLKILDRRIGLGRNQGIGANPGLEIEQFHFNFPVTW